jgi:mannose-1-phosphate guanylyltransferase/mannose-6-phosphate isomerase
MIRPVILAGGSGTRLWPLSRSRYPKQLINLVGRRTLLQNTIQRLEGVREAAAPVVICNDAHRFMVADQLRQVGLKAEAIILEPVGRNTAPALAVAAIRATARGDDPVLLVLPADHHIAQIDRFEQVVAAGLDHARQGRLITFGIVPEAPETGYGYIKMGDLLGSAGGDRSAVAIAAFVEKPDLERARQYVASKAYCWNSGMFMFAASQVLAELERFVPEIVAACRKAVAHGIVDLDFFRLNRAAFAACPSDSIDYAVMEKTDRGAMIPLSAGWNDLGSWEALWQVSPKDDCDNVVRGDVVLHDVGNSYLHADHRLIAAVGLADHIVVETADAVLISPRDRVQDVKGLVDALKAQDREETRTHQRLYRPWGTVDQLVKGGQFQVNRIIVQPGGALSLQTHAKRSEHWIAVHGTALVTRGEERFELNAGSSTYIPAGTCHRLENAGQSPLELIEVQTGGTIAEDDIVRMQDRYGRDRHE